MKLPAFLTQPIRLPQLDALTVTGIVVAMVAMSVLTVDRFIGLPFQGQAASMYGTLPIRTLHTGSGSAKSSVETRKIERKVILHNAAKRTGKLCSKSNPSACKKIPTRTR